jgi:hypothetical protein
MKKGNFFHFFWAVWMKSFTEKLIPQQPKTPEPVQRVYDGNDWHTINRYDGLTIGAR